MEKNEDRGSSDDNDSDDDRRLVITIRVRAWSRERGGGGEGEDRTAGAVRVLELGAIGRRHYSHRLRLPHGPIGLSSHSYLLFSFLSLHSSLHARFCPRLFLTPSPSLFPTFPPFPSLFDSFSLARYSCLLLLLLSFMPSRFWLSSTRSDGCIVPLFLSLYLSYLFSLGCVFYLARPSITSYAIRMKKNNCYIRCTPGGCVNAFYSWRSQPLDVAIYYFLQRIYISRDTSLLRR